MQRLRYKILEGAKKPGSDRFAVLFIDLNRFKHINDNFGHGVGDRVLIEVAHRLKSTVRSKDLVARLSGDEFVILLDQVSDRDGLERVRQQIHAALEEPLDSLGKGAIEVTDFGGSVGEALYPDDGKDAESLLKKADRRMYNQKFANRADSGFGPLRRSSDASQGSSLR
jgi:diguanylate cyclase (GGDEF)-like protein